MNFISYLIDKLSKQVKPKIKQNVKPNNGGSRSNDLYPDVLSVLGF